MIPVEGKKQRVTTVSSLEQCANKRKHHPLLAPTELTYQDPHNLRNENPVAGYAGRNTVGQDKERLKCRFSQTLP